MSETARGQATTAAGEVTGSLQGEPSVTSGDTPSDAVHASAPGAVVLEPPGATEPVLRVEVTARPEDIQVVRAALRSWLTARGVPHPLLDEIVLAVDEAVTNSVEHAYRGRPPGPVTLTATPEAATTRITITDHGTWREPTTPTDPRLPIRGRGLTILRAIATRVTITPADPGTTITAHFPTT
ncbi:ATP-binding protein [Actinokineospora globicatena]|uniref:Histidine kinase/HSP90-like ATPase domain-containing protein n=1 Tax=Actinokineospora globicatena TaxID=103729 RepID=A0A9W6QP77_9PSEU|nr:ATP-binding protein [Actinokineospora globicatena]GLW93420.1 hypothetical protein Aglo03_42360 [Actinokineospora globicatena]